MKIITQGDTLNTWTQSLESFGQKFDLTGATLTLGIQNLLTGVEVTRTAATVSALIHRATYQPVADDVATPGVFALQWRASKGGKTISFQAEELKIVPKIGT